MYSFISGVPVFYPGYIYPVFDSAQIFRDIKIKFYYNQIQFWDPGISHEYNCVKCHSPENG